MDPNKFLKMVSSMREAQKAYEASPTQLRLRERKAAELAVDQAIARLTTNEPKPTQGAMFP